MKYLEESAAEAINLKGPNLKVVSLFLILETCEDLRQLAPPQWAQCLHPSLKELNPIKHPGSCTIRVSQVLQCEPLLGCYFPQCV